jgi:murein DD-endopeptidase MepM/ murein hydrolase activator NlpD
LVLFLTSFRHSIYTPFVKNKSSVGETRTTTQRGGWISGIAWFIALVMTALAIYLGWVKWAQGGFTLKSSNSQDDIQPTNTAVIKKDQRVDTLPTFNQISLSKSIPRLASLYTDIPNRPRRDIVEHTVDLGDSVFAISQEYGIKPETFLWSNYDVLKDNPHAISVGMVLKIPPVDGVYYQWKEGDSLERVAAGFETTVDDILYWPGNRLDLTNPEIYPESWVMIPGGQREFQQWIVPVMPRGAAGVSSGVYGGGACPGGYDGLYGTGAFIWPTINHGISGNDYWSGHLAIDIGAALGEPISAADSGVVVFSGWATGGYGYTVAIDHGNGYSTLYAHLNSVIVSCGRSVTQGQTIGYGGSTGNSTGPHLHFEIRYQGGFINPWYVLPAP